MSVVVAIEIGLRGRAKGQERVPAKGMAPGLRRARRQERATVKVKVRPGILTHSRRGQQRGLFFLHSMVDRDPAVWTEVFRVERG